MGFLWNWNGTSDVSPSQGLYLYWQLHLPQDDLFFMSRWSLRTSLLLLGPCPCVEHIIGWNRSSDSVSGDPGQRVLAGTASLGHVSSCLWSPPDVTEVVQPEQSIYGDFCSNCWQCLADMEDAARSCGWPGWGQRSWNQVPWILESLQLWRTDHKACDPVYHGSLHSWLQQQNRLERANKITPKVKTLQSHEEGMLTKILFREESYGIKKKERRLRTFKWSADVCFPLC